MADEPEKGIDEAEERFFRALADPGLLILLSMNLIALGLAWHYRWSLASLLLIYWIQSAVVGAGYILRVVLLRLEGEPRAVWEKKWSVIGGFLAIYLIFQMGILFFIFVMSAKAKVDLGGPALYWWTAAGFALSEVWTLARQVAADRRAPRAIEDAGMPLFRIFPTHIGVVFGMGLFGAGFSVPGVTLFGILKIAVDLLTYYGYDKWQEA